ncbi:hypothetical protein QFZ67_003276 [Streptomyces sp. V1I1]|nr:hypothetical protein [Streptomyces sp. V1I1]
MRSRIRDSLIDAVAVLVLIASIAILTTLICHF